MAENIVETLVTKLTADVADLKKGMLEAEGRVDKSTKGINKDLKSTDKQLGKTSQAFLSMGKKVIGFAAAYASVSTVVSGMNRADELGKLSSALQFNVEKLQGLEFAASQTGVSFDALKTSINALNGRVAAASRGSLEAIEGFEALGISIEELGELGAEELFLRIADGISEIDSPTQKASAAIAVFGEQGTRMINLLNGGRVALEEFHIEASNLGIVLAEDTIRNIEQTNDAADKLIRQLKNLAVEAVDTIIGFETASEVIDIWSGALKNAKQAAKDAEATGDSLQFLENFSPGIWVDRLIEAGLALEETKKKSKELEVSIESLNQEIADAEIQLGKWQELSAKNPGLALLRKNVETTENVIAGLREELSKLEEKENERLENERKRSAEYIKIQADMQANIEAIRSENADFERQEMSPNERLKAELDDRLEIIKMAADAEIEVEGLKEDTIAMYRKRMAQAAEAEADRKFRQFQSHMSMASSLMGGLTQLMNSESRKLFEIGKIAAISQATIDTIAAAAGAYKWGNNLGGPPLGAVAAGIATASGIARVAAIQGTQFGSGGNASAGGGSTTSALNEQLEPVATPAPQTFVDINVIGSENAFIDRTQLRNLTENLNELTDDGIVLRTNA